jgi:hypothetical protein
MHPVEVLLEVIQARPSLIWPWAARAEAHVHHLGPALRLFVVHAFLMTGKVIDSPESFLARTIRLVAFEQLLMASLVFPTAITSVL